MMRYKVIIKPPFPFPFVLEDNHVGAVGLKRYPKEDPSNYEGNFIKFTDTIITRELVTTYANMLRVSLGWEDDLPLTYLNSLVAEALDDLKMLLDKHDLTHIEVTE